LALVKLNSQAVGDIVEINGTAIGSIVKFGGTEVSAGSYENFTTYTEVDAESDFTVTATKALYDTMERDVISYVYKDYGTNYFDNFDINFEIEVTYSQNVGLNGLFAISNTIDTLSAQITATDGIHVRAYANSSNMTLYLKDANTGNEDSWVVGGTTIPLRYCRITRVGTTCTLYIYSDSARTTLVDTLSITCETGAKRYLYALCSYETASTGNDQSGYTQNLQILAPDYEDLTTYTETDSDSDITITENKCDVSSMRRDADSYVYKDFGAAHFGDFTINFECLVSGTHLNGSAVMCMLSNTVGTIQDQIVANDGIVFHASGGAGSLTFSLSDYNTDNTDSYVDGGTTSNLLYCTFTRVGTTATVKIYSNATRTTLIDTISITSQGTALRYLSVMASRDTSGDGTHVMNTYTQNFEIISPSTEDLRTYTEVDENADVTVTRPKIAFDTMRRDATTYVYYDFGADYFDDYIIYYEQAISYSENTALHFLGTSNTIGSLQERDTANDGLHMFMQNLSGNLYHAAQDYSNDNVDSDALSGSTRALSYCIIKRVGTTFTAELYSDAARTTLVASASITCETDAHRYLTWGSRGQTVADTETISGYVQNIKIIKAS
jgi:hypothetical protein